MKKFKFIYRINICPLCRKTQGETTSGENKNTLCYECHIKLAKENNPLRFKYL